MPFNPVRILYNIVKSLVKLVYSSPGKKVEFGVSEDTPGPLINAPCGPIEGFVHKTAKGDTHCYLGIPYAEKPVGELRLELPRPARPWTSILKAKQFGLVSVPHHDCGTKWEYSEDSLTISVLTPAIHKPGGYPVVFFSHPSAFSLASAKTMRYEGFCENIVAEGCVFVMFQYRYGYLGFASTGDAVMPGNLGLHDQVLALDWTRRNISAFNGNPSRITGWGMSTGGISVSLLAISPKTRDYFVGHVQNSGGILEPSLFGNHVVLETRKLARALGCVSEDSAEIKRCLKKASIKQLMSAQEKLGITRDMFKFRWVPRLDGDLFPEDLPELIKKARPTPCFSGYTSDEMLYFYNGFLKDGANLFIDKNKRENFDEEQLIYNVRNRLFTEEDYGPNHRKIADMVLDYYISEQSPKHKDPLYWLNIEQKLLSHLAILVPMYMENKLKAEAGWPVYVYQNAHWREGHFDPKDKNAAFRGCMHVSEMKQFCGAPVPTKYVMNAEDLKHKHALIQSHLNFFKTGNPSFDDIEWPKVDNDSLCCNVSLLPNSRINDKFVGDQKALEFWLKMIDEFGDTVIRTIHGAAM
ncbi:unnamed protein product [Bursaphelenchus xylophilus]|uniref:(pine wood nematode) hypothetical protein n=1 Tax=Bursaphelenchus xylophilus TaxID=6326 RepID=A0A1I7S6L1_BURXY|nr:unnamed protein product [Bursaphelenchus xylophilus]CAD5229802.1 unnamed protein product [Bursaphelenchus xylophilus]CAG9120531.1 unnamed protein product [Bursaphelenchus xylophilus]CAG9120537.1 unnamed protein product [Bursaphelenchus xylophilus]